MGEIYRLKTLDRITEETENRLMRDGTELEKGVILTNEKLEDLEELLQKYINFWTAYPDLFLDMILPANKTFNLFFYQRLFLRVCMRFRDIFITASRATSKTFLSILAKYLQCIFVPGHKSFIVAPNKTQAAKISQGKIKEIWSIWPLLEKEVTKANMGKDYTLLEFKNGSIFTIVGALDSDRGQRFHSGLIDEARDQDGDMISEVVVPMVNVSRRTIQGTINPYEAINQQIIYATSAGDKSSYAYSALIDIFERSIINPKQAFCLGLDYRIPALHGLIDKKFVEGLKLSPSYNELTFAAEYMSMWTGGNSDAWFQYDKMTKYRKIKNPEWRQKFREDKSVFYLISVDVARVLGGDQSAASVFRVNIKDNKYYATLVNLVVLGKTAQSKTFTQQAIDIKHLIQLYDPIEVVIDTNGLTILAHLKFL